MSRLVRACPPPPVMPPLSADLPETIAVSQALLKDREVARWLAHACLQAEVDFSAGIARWVELHRHWHPEADEAVPPRLDALCRPRPTPNSGWSYVGELGRNVAADEQPLGLGSAMAVYHREVGPYVWVAVLSLSLVEGEGEVWILTLSTHHRRRGWGRAGADVVSSAQKAFGLHAAIEDNHAQLRVMRTFWLQLDPARRAPCACDETDPDFVGVAGAGDNATPYVWRRANGGGASMDAAIDALGDMLGIAPDRLAPEPGEHHDGQ